MRKFKTTNSTRNIKRWIQTATELTATAPTLNWHNVELKFPSKIYYYIWLASCWRWLVSSDTHTPGKHTITYECGKVGETICQRRRCIDHCSHSLWVDKPNLSRSFIQFSFYSNNSSIALTSVAKRHNYTLIDSSENIYLASRSHALHSFFLLFFCAVQPYSCVQCSIE